MLSWPEVGKFEVAGGRWVQVWPAPGVSEARLRPALLGPVMALLLLQRGRVVLHAGAAALRGADDGTDNKEFAIAFLGEAGAGKSTLAAALVARGARPVTDDLLAVETSHAHPGFSRLKLRAPSLQALGCGVAGRALWHPGGDSYAIETPGFSVRPAPLAAIVTLAVGPVPALEWLSLPAALGCLLEQSYAQRIWPAHAAADFARLAALVRRVPVARLVRPLDFARLQEVTRLLEKMKVEKMG